VNNNPIFILGAHKSGTSLLRSLFDGHSQLYVIPFETHYFQNMKYWVDNEYRKERPVTLTQEEIVDSFCDWIHHCNTTVDFFADSITKGLFDEQIFRESFLSSASEHDDDKTRIEGYFTSIYRAIERKELPDSLRIVEKSVENAEFAYELSNLFPAAKFIHIVRNPYANFVSIRRYKSHRYGYPIIRRVVKTLYNSYYYLYKNQRTIKNYKVIEYENLVLNPKEQLTALCDFLEIVFEDILLSPTFRNQPWKGNSTTGEQFNGISSAQLDNWKNEIHPLEIFYVNLVFPFVFRDYHYQMVDYPGGFWKKIRGESLKRYMANRIYKYLIQS